MSRYASLTADPAVEQMLEVAHEKGIETAFDRAEKVKPCPIGAEGACCKICAMGPCRIDPFEEGPQRGVCGADADIIVARNLGRMIAAGAASHSDHGRDLVDVLAAVAEGNAPGYQIRDVEKLKEHVEALSQREGNEWHRILLSDLRHPMSLKQVVFAGDTLLDEPSSVLIVGELPVANRKGQIDITVFLRREIPGRIIWTPVMILEIKTKTSFDFNLYGVRTSNRHREEYAPALYVWKRALNEKEWESIITSNPDEQALTQLNVYETELLQEYKQLAGQDPTPPKSLWKGVVVLDTDQNYLEVFNAFQFLLEDLTMGLIDDIIDASNSNSYTLDNNDILVEAPKVAAILTPSIGPIELLNEAVVANAISIEDPFSERKLLFPLYLFR